jgi:hypothetical protein
MFLDRERYLYSVIDYYHGSAQSKMNGRMRMDKIIHLKVDRGDETISLREVIEKITEIQAKNPDREVFWDGDANAICSRKK